MDRAPDFGSVGCGFDSCLGRLCLSLIFVRGIFDYFPMTSIDESTHSLIRMLIARLERVSVDSFWAHRASGVKGSLLRLVEKSEKGYPLRRAELNRTMDLGFSILENAAREKGDPDAEQPKV
jgi:hypothetical protein